MILPDFCDSLVFVILKCQVLYYKLLSRKFCDKNFRDQVKFTKITKIFDQGNLELYGMLCVHTYLILGHCRRLMLMQWPVMERLL